MKIYPSNKEHFKKLIPFAKKIITLCQKNGINPVIYGSFAHFYYTKDENMKVNDVDLLIPKKDLLKVFELLKKNKFKTEYFPEWNTMGIKKGKLKVEIDGVGFWYKDLDNSSIFKNPKEIDFYGIKIKIMSLKNLEKLYLIGYERTKDNKEKIKEKIKHLEKFLERKLK